MGSKLRLFDAAECSLDDVFNDRARRLNGHRCKQLVDDAPRDNEPTPEPEARELAVANKFVSEAARDSEYFSRFLDRQCGTRQ
jgi:hypothetical protein